jgi:hypothetical protein
LGIVLSSSILAIFIVGLYSLSINSPNFTRQYFKEGPVGSLISTNSEGDIRQAVSDAFPEIKFTPFSDDRAGEQKAVDEKIAACRRESDGAICAELLSRVNKIQKEQEKLIETLDRLIAENSPSFGAKLLVAMVVIATINSGIYFLSFIASLATTLFLLRFMERARADSIVVCLLDLMLAVVIPIFILTMAYSLFVFLVPFRPTEFLDSAIEGDFEKNMVLFYVVTYFYFNNFTLLTAKVFSIVFGPVTARSSCTIMCFRIFSIGASFKLETLSET